MPYKNKEDKNAHNAYYRETHKDYYKVYLSKWRKTNPEYSRDYTATHPEEIKVYRAKGKKVYRQKPENALKERARSKVHYAIRTGKLERPEECSDCLSICTPEGHHSDYSKPLEVMWFCKKCHEKVHHGEFAYLNDIE